jgi:hypothetical protein
MNIVPTAAMTTTATVIFTSAIRSNSTNIHTDGGKIIITIISKTNIKVYYNNSYSYNWDFACSNLGSNSDYCKVVMGLFNPRLFIKLY